MGQKISSWDMGRPVETIKTLKLISKIMLQISRR